MSTAEITAGWLRQHASRLHQKATSVESAYKSAAIRKYTTRVANAYRDAAIEFERVADEIEDCLPYEGIDVEVRGNLSVVSVSGSHEVAGCEWIGGTLSCRNSETRVYVDDDGHLVIDDGNIASAPLAMVRAVLAALDSAPAVCDFKECR